MNRHITPKGGYGADIELTHTRNTEHVFWSLDHNSYVIVASNAGKWLFKGKRVELWSINGIGEVRWRVDPWMVNVTEHPISPTTQGMIDAVKYFGLAPT